MTDQNQEHKIWIRTAPDLHGVYRVSLEFDDDTAFTLSPETAAQYANYVLQAAAAAEHDAAIVAQLSKLTDDMKAAVQIVADLRADRPALSAVSPLSLEPGVSAYTGEPFLSVKVDGEAAGQWTVADAREHAIFAMEAIHVADLDGAYLRVLRGVVQLDEDRARAVVGDLLNWRKEAK
jgi:hypothetical protein